MSRHPHSLLLASLLAFPAALAPGVAAADLAADEAAAPAGSAATERDTAYRAFRREFEAGFYSDALPYAERVVALTEQLDPQDPNLASALNNLGATQYRLGDFVAAEQAYGRALRLTEDLHGSMSARLIAPLRGLALTYQGTGRNDVAVPLLERAVAISRRTQGLFNAGQKELLSPLIDGYVALARWVDANRSQHYALQVAEHQYGNNDPRLLPALQQIAQWFEITHQHAKARATWQRLLAIESDAAHPDTVGQIIALRGIADTYRLDYQSGPELEEQAHAGEPPLQFASDPESVRRTVLMSGPEPVLASQGYEALEKAFKLADSLKPPSPTARAAVLVDLGDWHILEGRFDRALPFYNRALPLIAPSGGASEAPGAPLSYPTVLLYRPPASALRHRDQPSALVVEKYAIAEFTVTADGHVRDARIVEGDASEAQRAGLLLAVEHALYRPRFVDGKPAATDKVRLRERFRQMAH